MLRRLPVRPKRPTPRRKSAPAPRIKLRRVVDLPHLARVRGLGCILCRKAGRGWVAAEAHHIKRKPDGSLYGASQKAGDHEAIPLCPDLHHWNGVHRQSKLSHREFERQYGNELDLLEETMRELSVAEVG